jgi:hypothetical protein
MDRLVVSALTARGRGTYITGISYPTPIDQQISRGHYSTDDPESANYLPDNA